MLSSLSFHETLRKLICEAAELASVISVADGRRQSRSAVCLHHNYALYCMPQSGNFKTRTVQEDSRLVACDAVSLGECVLHLEDQAVSISWDSLTLQNITKYSPNDTASHATPPLFKVRVFSVPPAAQWSGRHLWAPVGPDGESRPKHMRYDGNPAPGDTMGLQAEERELPREPVPAHHHTVQGEQRWARRAAR